jgi:hypothetical protein
MPDTNLQSSTGTLAERPEVQSEDQPEQQPAQSQSGAAQATKEAGQQQKGKARSRPHFGSSREQKTLACRFRQLG